MKYLSYSFVRLHLLLTLGVLWLWLGLGCFVSCQKANDPSMPPPPDPDPTDTTELTPRDPALNSQGIPHEARSYVASTEYATEIDALSYWLCLCQRVDQLWQMGWLR